MSASSRYAEGSSRASTGSSGGSLGPVKFSIASSGSASLSTTARSLRSSSTSWPARLRRRSASKAVKVATAPPPRMPPKPRCRRSPIRALHRGPEAVLVHGPHVALHLLAAAGRDHRAAVLVHLQHQLLGLLARVAEVLLEHEGDVGHQ